MKCLVTAVVVVVFSACSAAAVLAEPAPGGAASVPAVRTGLAQKPEVADAIQLLESWVESQMAYRGIPGLSLGIVHDQELVWARGYGYANGEKNPPAPPATLYRIASNSKLFTSVAVLQLRDAGKLGLDDPVEKHLTWFALRNRQPGEAPVTIRSLLTHTGGLPREAAFPYWADLRFPTRQQIQETVPGQERVFPPYTKWKYSNLGLTLAGEIVETVSGEPYSDYVRRHIFEPLGMSGSSVGVPDTLRSRLATGYGRRLPDGTRSVRPFSDLAGLDPAGGLTSSVEDLAKFASLQFRDGPEGGAQILAGATLREMQRVHWISPDWKGAWGLGFEIVRQEDRTLVGHGGWVAGYQTSFITWPQGKIAVIALTNADDGQPYPGSPFSVVDRFFKWVTPALKNAAEPAPRKGDRRPEWEAYVGQYRSPWGDSQIMILADRLTLVSLLDVDPSTTKLTLVEVAPHTFRTESNAPFVEDGDIVAFDLDPQGKATRMRFGGDRMDRVAP